MPILKTKTTKEYPRLSMHLSSPSSNCGFLQKMHTRWVSEWMRHHPHLYIIVEAALGLCLFTKKGWLIPIVVKTTLINPRGRLLKYHHMNMVWPIHKRGFGLIQDLTWSIHKRVFDLYNTKSNIIRIFFAVTIFQHSPLTRRVFYNIVRRERVQQHLKHWLTYI